MADIAHQKLLARCAGTWRWRFHLGRLDREYQDDVARAVPVFDGVDADLHRWTNFLRSVAPQG